MNENKEWYLISFFTGEDACALLAEQMAEHYVNCEFEAVEYGDGTYKLMVSSKYYGYDVEHSTRTLMLTTAIQMHLVIATVLRKLRERGLMK